MMHRPSTLLAPALLALAVAACSESHVPGSGNSDAGPVTLDSCFQGLAPTGGAAFVGTLSFESEDRSTRVRLARQPGDRSAVGETFAYDLVRFGIERNGVVECITDPDALLYDFGHHNWDDAATANGSAEYTVRIRLDITGKPPSWTDTLQTNDTAPIPLVHVRCDVTPLDLNHCTLRNSL